MERVEHEKPKITKRNQTSLRDFFKKPKLSNDSQITVIEEQKTNEDVSYGGKDQLPIEKISDQFPMEEGLEPLPVPMEEKRFNDISSYVNRKLSNEEKLKALAGLWEPDKKYVFPAEDYGRFKRHFQTNWLMQFKWLAYSDQEKGTFCKFCVLFRSEDTVGKGKHVMIGKLVSKPCKNLKDSLEIFRSHERTSYHQNCMLTADSIRSISEKETEDIAVQVDNRRKVTARKTRAALVPIVQTIRLCGKQQIALRGHQDSGRITLEDPEKNVGNFRALLRYRAAGGVVDLRQYLVMSAGNAMYTSPRIQNEIINTFGEMIQMQIRDRVHKSGLFSVLADETTDIAGIQQFSLCVRYLEDATASVREDFLCFVPVNDVTGKGLCTTIKDTLSNLGIDLHNLRGQGYDGVLAMRGEFRGVQANSSRPVAVIGTDTDLLSILIDRGSGTSL
ncbi:zinc finger MYM-type protein 1-like [Uloborus diversus]|uniref:zinc finger MYM-type protein 1-like n=1 Tax=Uloborus diversus TaxID=327109 RepID=UPI00240A0F5A|nr:zinc finger MYM-type protein 1-like [Uloborus diversus]